MCRNCGRQHVDHLTPVGKYLYCDACLAEMDADGDGGDAAFEDRAGVGMDDGDGYDG